MKSDLNLKCPDCEEVFGKKFDFFEHRNIHSGETPFMCLNCRKSFSLIKLYVNHIKSQHFQNNKSKNQSSELPQNTNNDISLKTLQSNNSKEGNYLEITDVSQSKDLFCCKKCSKFFENKRHLKNHLCVTNFKNHTTDATICENVSKQCKCCSCQIIDISSEKAEFCLEKLKTNACKSCCKNFSSSEELIKHTCSVSLTEENLRCSCSQVFSKASAFKAHIKGKPYSCCSCSMKFNTITNLIRHIRTHTKQKPYVCKECGRGFSQSAHLRNHSSIHLGISAVKCNECNFSCKTFNGLLKHKKKHKEGFINHQNYIDGRKKSTKISTCPICNKQFLFKRNMGMHMKIHNNKISLCTECGKVFDSKGKLTSHFKACHKEPSVCKTCGKIFASAVLLGAHEKIHVSEKPYSCNVCHKTFSIKNYLVQHMKTHSDKKQFSCSKCGKLFKVAVSLKYHSNICTSLNIPV